jgi:hypothetical protein
MERTTVLPGAFSFVGFGMKGVFFDFVFLVVMSLSGRLEPLELQRDEGGGDLGLARLGTLLRGREPHDELGLDAADRDEELADEVLRAVAGAERLREADLAPDERVRRLAQVRWEAFFAGQILSALRDLPLRQRIRNLLLG